MMFKSPAALAAVQREPAPRRTASNKILLLVLPLLAVASAAQAAPETSETPPADVTPSAVAAPAAASLAATPVWGQVEGLSRQALRMALDAVSCARAGGASGRPNLLTVIDYSLPSTTPRLWVLDLGRRKVLFHELVAHGAGSGDNFATRFSNTADSRQSSLGLFLTGGTYEGGNGYSLKLHGLDAGVNDRAEQRNIVIHGAWYVSPEHASQYGRLGRSWGCPALPLTSAHQVIDTIKDGSFVFSYAPRATVLQAASRGGCAVSRPAPAVARPAPAVSRAARAAVAASVAVVKAVVATP